MALLSQAISFSPEGALRKDGVVVVVTRGNVVATISVVEEVDATSADFAPHAASPMRRGRSSRAFFTDLLCQ